MAENVRVVVRCRPMNKKEHESRCHNIIEIEDCSVSVKNPTDLSAPPKSFTYDSVYDALAPTEAIYNDICYSLVDNVLEGYNGTIFAYGQTGCGKTHTMQGPDNDDSDANSIPSSQRGIISRTFDHIFEAISVASGVRYLALVSYLEIYNENIRDLLNPNETSKANHPLKELPGVGVTVPTLSTQTVHNAQECYQLLSLGNRNRRVGATLMNEKSSRSHSIFTISLEQIHDSNEDDDFDNIEESAVTGGSGIRRGKLNLVDLAGSERQNKTGAFGERLKEATKINLSLSALGNVISALVDGKTKHIPYRDSKLTRLLQDSLGGNTKTLMISCISPADVSYDETLSTLRYASRAKNIANKPKINEDPKDAKLREYQEEIMKLKKMLHETNLHTKPPLQIPVSIDDEETKRSWLQAERAKLQKNMEQEMEHLKNEHMKQQRENEEQQSEMAQLRSYYEDQLKRLSTANAQESTLASESRRSSTDATTLVEQQMEARKRIESIKQALIGGERANDMQLKERRQKKKLDAQRRLSALAHVLSRVEQREDRDLLQGHYTNIQQELNAKNEYLKNYRQKVKALEREVSDLQAEFQLDRADYLESIRRLERNLKFYQQIMEKALPILRKDGKYWDPNEILQISVWNDDLKIWKLPETAMNSFKLPPATAVAPPPRAKSYFPKNIHTTVFPINDIHGITTSNSDQDEDIQSESTNGKHDNSFLQRNAKEISQNEMDHKVQTEDDINKIDILNNYFRSNRQKSSALSNQRRGLNSWKGAIDACQQTLKQRHVLILSKTASAGRPAGVAAAQLTDHFYTNRADSNRGMGMGLSELKGTSTETIPPSKRTLSSWLPFQEINGNADAVALIMKTWSGSGCGGSLLSKPVSNNFKTNSMQKLTEESIPHLEPLPQELKFNSGLSILNRQPQIP